MPVTAENGIKSFSEGGQTLPIHQTMSADVLIRRTLGAVSILFASALLLPIEVRAESYSLNGETSTYLRLATTTDKKNSYLLNEYLRVSTAVTENNGSTTSLHFGGWGMIDQNDINARGKTTDGSLQYGYLSYQGAKNNLLLSAGRQFITEGVATQRLDGLYARSDLAAGFGTAVYVGAPVSTGMIQTRDDLLFGGRITQSNGRLYTVGVSALKSFAQSSRYRDEAGADLWLQPAKQVDITGNSSYNTITRDWMEHHYSVSYTPADEVKLSADFSAINYRDYFFRVTTNALVFNPLTNGISPDEKVLTAGCSGSYTVLRNITIAGDFKRYNYRQAHDANYFGGKVTFSPSDSFSAGVSVHRMEGGDIRLKYTEYRGYATGRLGSADLTLDVTDLNYDSTTGTNGIDHVITVMAGGTHGITEEFRLGVSADYSRNPLFNSEVRGLVKLTYLFDVKSPSGGRK